MVCSTSTAQRFRYLTSSEMNILINSSWECPHCLDSATISSPVICHDITHPVHAKCELQWFKESGTSCCSYCRAEVTTAFLGKREIQYPLSEVLWNCAKAIANCAKMPFVQMSSLASTSIISGYWTGYSILIPLGFLIEILGISMVQKSFEAKGIAGPAVIEHLKTRLDGLKKSQEEKKTEIQKIETYLKNERQFLKNLNNYCEKLPEGVGALNNTVRLEREWANSLSQKQEELRSMQRQCSFLEVEYLSLRNNETILFHKNMYSICKTAKCFLAAGIGFLVIFS